jgi:hypothetical protein
MKQDNLKYLIDLRERLVKIRKELSPYEKKHINTIISKMDLKYDLEREPIKISNLNIKKGRNL